MTSSSDSSKWTTTTPSRTTEPSPIAQPSNQDQTSGKGNDFDLDQNVARQARHLDGRARRWLAAEIFRPAVDLVHRGKVVHVLDEHRGLHGAVEIAAGGLQDGPQVLQHLMGLLGH